MTDIPANFENKAKAKIKPKGNPNWVKGGPSPNPAGRPAVLADLREAARGYSQEALETLANVMRDPEAPPAARVAAARELLDRGYGRAVQAIDVGVKVDIAKAHADVLWDLTQKAREAKASESRVIDVMPLQNELSTRRQK